MPCVHLNMDWGVSVFGGSPIGHGGLVAVGCLSHRSCMIESLCTLDLACCWRYIGWTHRYRYRYRWILSLYHVDPHADHPPCGTEKIEWRRPAVVKPFLPKKVLKWSFFLVQVFHLHPEASCFHGVAVSKISNMTLKGFMGFCLESTERSTYLKQTASHNEIIMMLFWYLSPAAKTFLTNRGPPSLPMAYSPSSAFTSGHDSQLASHGRDGQWWERYATYDGESVQRVQESGTQLLDPNL